ncbi:cytochrome b [Roseomonas sp. E05]|uniref:cytochrome b n=1 Tax=Roseomonas sp. E05 TaxID=3046310 RepID=UPI0024B9C9E7|nr:cytochrome b [Roseomonas sp. E05]MDJ0389361.1 cytochrome b [Roseomonas sp. E05]
MRYNRMARLLHWGTALIVLLIIALGVWIAEAPPEDEALKLRLYNIHESFGITILVVTLFRLFWRRRHPPPPITPPLPGWMQRAATTNHAAFYVLLMVQPVVGLMTTNAWGFPLTAFGLIPIPSPIGPNEKWAPVLSSVHDTIGLTLAALVALHVSAALWHHFVRRDDTLRRMTW